MAESKPARSETATALALLFLWALVLVPPFLLLPTAKDPFRLPKLLVSEWLGLASLLPLTWKLRRAGSARPWELPPVRAVAPFLLLATFTAATSSHLVHVREALYDLWIGAACLVGWSLALEARRLRRLLDALLVPACALSLLAILQFHGLYRPLAFAGGEQVHRMGVTALAGNPGDLAGYLILPCLIAQAGLPLAAGWGRALRLGALALLLYGLAVTQTLTALVCLAAASPLLWLLFLARRRSLAAAAVVLAGLTAASSLLTPLRWRVLTKLRQLGNLNLDALLSGRLDGWRMAWRMLRDNPWTGVGHGAFRPAFIPAKEALLAEGARFYPRQPYPVFANAHNEYLEAAAEVGIPGFAALVWGSWILLTEAARLPVRGLRGRSDRALAWSGIAALAVLSLTQFPFRTGLIAFPALLFLSWVFRAAREEP